MANEGNRERWDASGRLWVEHQRTFDRMLEPIGELLLGAAGVRSGERVLDIGCGYGTTSMALANSGAVVHGVDISAPMIEAATERVPKASFAVADAQVDDLGGPFDVLVSRFGVMFFDDPFAAFANLHRHGADGGRLVFVCWHDELASTAIWAGAEAILPALPSPPPPRDPLAPGPFAFADESRVREILAEAGFGDIKIEGHELTCVLGWPDSDGVEERIAMFRDNELGLMMRQQLDADQQAAVIADMRKALAARVVDGVLTTDASVWLVTATV